MSAITITNPLPAELVALSQETIERADALLLQANRQRVTDVASYERANALYRELASFAKSLESQRVGLKRPILDLGRALDEAAKTALVPLEVERSSLGDRIAAFEAAENDRRCEERRQAEEAAAAATREAMERSEFERLPDAPVFDVPDVRPVAAVATAPMLKGAVKRKVVRALVIDDVRQIPVEIGGVRLLVPDASAIKHLLEMGATVPGCRLVEEIGTAAKGVRS